MTLAEKIIRELWNKELTYKGIKVNMFGIPIFRDYSKRAIQLSINDLFHRDLIEREGDVIRISKKGRKYIEKKIDSLKTFDCLKEQAKEKTLLVMFDIPENKKAEREWFRWHLKKFNYILIQRSVWVGPAPLPKDFLSYLKEIKLSSCIKTFTLAKPYKSIIN